MKKALYRFVETVPTLWREVAGGLVVALIIYLTTILYEHPLRLVVCVVGVLSIVIVAWFVVVQARSRTRMLIYLSAGGTCRDPMAKAITDKLLEDRMLKFRIDVRAVGLAPGNHSHASYAARYVIREMYGEDLLKEHRATPLTNELIERADLILAMEKSMLLTPGKMFPKGKAFGLKEFFELPGEVTDPWPDGKDAATLDRYRSCARELREILTANIVKLIDTLAV